MLSMTGYGEREAVTEYGVIKAEIKGVNNRYFTPTIKLPRQLGILEERIRKLTLHYVSRGRVDVTVTANGSPELPRTLTLAIDSLSKLIPQLYAVAERSGLESSIRLGDLLHIPGIFMEAEESVEADRFWSMLVSIMTTALESFRDAKLREGAAIKADLERSLVLLKNQIALINNENAQLLPFYRERLVAAAKRLAPTLSLDDNRLELEATMLAERSDITEEVNRINTHLLEFERLIVLDEPVGRRLDFIAQELIREITTIGSKTASAINSTLVIEFKSELDKIREQVQNVE